jgi:hypothetical protein
MYFFNIYFHFNLIHKTKNTNKKFKKIKKDIYSYLILMLSDQFDSNLILELNVDCTKLS